LSISTKSLWSECSKSCCGVPLDRIWLTLEKSWFIGGPHSAETESPECTCPELFSPTLLAPLHWTPSPVFAVLHVANCRKSVQSSVSANDSLASPPSVARHSSSRSFCVVLKAERMLALFLQSVWNRSRSSFHR
jgi:hypothetical protein